MEMAMSGWEGVQRMERAKSGWKEVLRREGAISVSELREGKGRRVDGRVEKENGDKWMGEWRRERPIRGWECGERKGR